MVLQTNKDPNKDSNFFDSSNIPTPAYVRKTFNKED